jgi:hypothetical protein
MMIKSMPQWGFSDRRWGNERVIVYLAQRARRVGMLQAIDPAHPPLVIPLRLRAPDDV